MAERIKAKLEGTPLALSYETSTDEERAEFSRRWIPAKDIHRCIEDVRHGRVYTFEAAAQKLRCSTRTAWLIFLKQPGVIGWNSFYRIPETVFQRVLHQIMNSGTVPDQRNNR